MLSAAWLVAWWSWAIQVLPLLGKKGLIPAQEFFSRAISDGAPSFWQAPSIFWLASGDVALLGGVICGLIFASAALIGARTQLCLALSALLYISYAAPAAPLLPMLGDKLLLEATVVAILLPRNGPAPWAHWLARLLVLKLYLQIGASQWLAPHNDWQRGQALASFLATTPLPTPLGWWADHLPPFLLQLGTKLAVLLELFAPFCLLGPRPLRLLAAAALSCVQLAALVLVNYGLFAFVSIALHLFFLEERDVHSIVADVRRVSPTLADVLARLWLCPSDIPAKAPAGQLPEIGRALLLFAYVTLSLSSFWSARGRYSALTAHTEPVRQLLSQWQLIHAYTHLQSAAQERIEPIFERRIAGVWQPVEFWRQPNDPWRSPAFVAPHLPRLDVSLSAWGLSDAHDAPPYFVQRLTHLLCHDPSGLQRLVRTPLQAPAEAVRVVFYKYEMASFLAHRQANLWWQRSEIGRGPQVLCASEGSTTQAPTEN